MLLANYLFFTTHCEAALAFYTACGLGQVTLMLRWGENGMPVPTEAMRGKIMHSRFEGPGVNLHDRRVIEVRRLLCFSRPQCL